MDYIALSQEKVPDWWVDSVINGAVLILYPKAEMFVVWLVPTGSCSSHHISGYVRAHDRFLAFCRKYDVPEAWATGLCSPITEEMADTIEAHRRYAH